MSTDGYPRERWAKTAYDEWRNFCVMHYSTLAAFAFMPFYLIWKKFVEPTLEYLQILKPVETYEISRSNFGPLDRD